jgi:cysteine desulfurase
MRRYTYLDNNATTTAPPAVQHAIAEWCNSGNASCTHPLARLCVRDVIDPTRNLVLSTVVPSGTVANYCCVFTSGGSEANSDVILGRALLSRDKPLRIVTSKAEHSSVLDLVDLLVEHNYATVSWLAVLPSGAIDRRCLMSACSGGVDLLIIQHANSELGAVNDVKGIARWLSRVHPSAYLHSDCVQTYCKIPVEVAPNMSIAVSAHKFHGPKGIGFYVKPRSMRLFPVVAGKQNEGLRGGTLNSPACAGMQAAIRLCQTTTPPDPVAYVRSYFRDNSYFVSRSSDGRPRNAFGVADASPGIAILTPEADRLPNTLALAVIRPDTGFVCGTTLKARLEEAGVIVANGSACQVGKPSALMSALSTVPAGHKKGMIRVSTSRLTTDADLLKLCQLLAKELQ